MAISCYLEELVVNVHAILLTLCFTRISTPLLRK
jgi:hypothetical protein